MKTRIIIVLLPLLIILSAPAIFADGEDSTQFNFLTHFYLFFTGEEIQDLWLTNGTLTTQYMPTYLSLTSMDINICSFTMGNLGIDLGIGFSYQVFLFDINVQNAGLNVDLPDFTTQAILDKYLGVSYYLWNDEQSLSSIQLKVIDRKLISSALYGIEYPLLSLSWNLQSKVDKCYVLQVNAFYTADYLIQPFTNLFNINNKYDIASYLSFSVVFGIAVF